MQLVCCPLPETKIAGQKVSLVISLDVAWLLFHHAFVNRACTTNGLSPDHGVQSAERQRTKEVNSAVVGKLIAHSPPLLLWLLSQVELHLPLCHPDQLVDKIRQLAQSQPFSWPIDPTEVADRIEIRSARFVHKIQALSLKPVVASESSCKLNQPLIGAGQSFDRHRRGANGGLDWATADQGQFLAGTFQICRTFDS